MTVGVKDLKNNLSYYLRKIAKGQRISVTAHGHVIAELGPPTTVAPALNRYRQLIADGAITPAREQGDPTEGWENLALRLPKGTAAVLIDWDRTDIEDRENE